MSQVQINKRVKELDGLRGLAILSVVLFHYTTRFDQIYGHTHLPFSFSYGHYGVQLFFMLSGYVIYLSIQNIDLTYDFIVKRFSRLYPAYWVSIMLTFLIVSAFGLPGRESSLLDAIINFTMLQDFLSSKLLTIHHVDGAYWTLSRFIVFYIFVSLLIAFRKKDKVILICIVWTILDICIATIDKNIIHIPGKFQLILLIRESGFFIIGMMFYLLKSNKQKKFSAILIGLNLIAIFYINGIVSFFFGIGFSSLFYLCLNDKIKFLQKDIFLFFGTISYSLYLIHQNIGYVIMRALYLCTNNFLIIIIIPFSVSIVLAFAITFFIEKPIMKLLRQYALKQK